MDPRQATRTSTKKLTYQDLLGFPDDGLRHELIDGEHYVSPTPITRHQRLVGRLYIQLSTYLERTPIGECFLAPLDVLLSIHDVVEPDLIVVLANRTNVITEKNIQGAPSIVIEVLSPGTRGRDERLKRALYERAGVPEYWLVYPDRNVVRVCRRSERGTFDTMPELSAATSDQLTSPLLPGFSAALTELFR